jgi:hypothetical protein
MDSVDAMSNSSKSAPTKKQITCIDIIDKFCSGPAAEGMPDMISDCVGSTTLEELMETVAHWHDFDNEAQAALFILKYLDYEAD